MKKKKKIESAFVLFENASGYDKNLEGKMLEILKLIEKIDDPKAKYLRYKIFSRLDMAKYRKEEINAIREYMINIDEFEIRYTKIQRHKNGYFLTTDDQAKQIIKALLYEKLAELEMKEKNYDEALKCINSSIDLKEISESQVELKAKILSKSKKKNEILDFLNETKKSYDYQSVKDLNFQEISEIKNRTQYDTLRKYLVKLKVDNLLKEYEKVC